MTHEVRGWPIAEKQVADRLSNATLLHDDVGYTLDRFVAFDGKWYFERPPFDHALLVRDGVEYVVPIDDLEWRVVAAAD